MEHAKKMALVPQELLETIQVQQNQATHPITKVLSSLDKEMQQILQRTDVADDEKAKLYQHTLQQYRAFIDKRKEPVKISIVPSQSTPDNTAVTSSPTDHLVNGAEEDGSDSTKPSHGVESDVIDSVPKSLRRKARLLLQKVKQHDLVDWNEKGELVFKGSPLPGTHMVDLVNDVLRRRKTFTPRGWQQFAQVLSTMNVPQDLIGNKDRWNWMETWRTSKGSLPTDDSEGELELPSGQLSTKKKARHRPVVSTAAGIRRRPTKMSSWVSF